METSASLMICIPAKYVKGSKPDIWRAWAWGTGQRCHCRKPEGFRLTARHIWAKTAFWGEDWAGVTEVNVAASLGLCLELNIFTGRGQGWWLGSSVRLQGHFWIDNETLLLRQVRPEKYPSWWCKDGVYICLKPYTTKCKYSWGLKQECSGVVVLFLSNPRGCAFTPEVFCNSRW